MFVSRNTHNVVILVGKSGLSKSLSIQLIIKKFLGELSESNFLKNYPAIKSTIFQGSEINTPELIKNIFKEVEIRLNNLLIFDNLDLLEKSKNNCLEILNSKLEIVLDKKERMNKISFIGISNSKLDAAKMNRTIFLSLSNILLDDIYLTMEAIAKSYDEKLLKKYKKEYKLLGSTFYFYKDKLMSLKDEFIMNFHDSRDF